MINNIKIKFTLLVVMLCFVLIACAQKKEELLDDIWSIRSDTCDNYVIETKYLAENIFSYINNDSYSNDDKLDVMFFLISHQESATRTLRGKIFNQIEETKKINPLYIPLLFCHYCDSVIEIDAAKFDIKISDVTDEKYVKIYDFLNSIWHIDNSFNESIIFMYPVRKKISELDSAYLNRIGVK